MNKAGIVSTRLGKEILGPGDTRNEMICFILRHRAAVPDNEPQEECRRAAGICRALSSCLQEEVY